MKQFYFFLFTLCLFTGVNAQIINFPDANFKAKLLEANSSMDIASNSTQVSVNFSISQPNGYCNIDLNNDGEIQVAEALNIQFLNISSSNISDITGIEYFVNLKVLYCNGNPLVNYNFTNLLNLQYFDFSFNQVSFLNLTGLTNLQYLNCSNNSLNNLILTGCFSLKKLLCYSNQLINLNVSSFVNFQYLDCEYNQLSNLNLDNLNNLSFLRCNNNLITELSLLNCSNLTYVGAYNNLIDELDLSSCLILEQLFCFNNQLTILNIKNGSTINNSVFLNFSSNPNLTFICADENEINDLNSIIFDYNLTNCHINSYCTFVPGGTFYTIQGQQKFDNESDGCDVGDSFIPNFKYSITDGTITGSIISNNSGNYFIPVQSGTHTITPVLENPTYFSVSPSNVVVDFPTQASPFTQNFCVTANGVHPDLEIILIPIVPARPGFDAVYKFVYKNKGTNTQSGNINLSFNDAVLDFVSAIPTIANQTLNNLSWNFTNLQPFETREITFTLNVNSPMETPAVNDGDVLNYSSSITSAATDENPNDNIFTLNQTVVNSFDPNDKTCLEGTTIAPSEVGKYMHYLIRFENNGTANAQNIVVKDMIDTAKFDINSLVPIKGSHSFVTNITSGNKVEFIFENINLPFDDANNDGYVAFKIKTKPTLVAGNTFSNSASIYFDYNFPIVTNTAVTTIQALSTQDFAFGTYFTVYPNPVNDVLNIETKQTIEVSSVSIYNQLGQLVLVIPNAQNTKSIDVSNLSSGNYFIKINSDKGTSNAKFSKK